MPKTPELLNKDQLGSYLQSENKNYLDQIVILEIVNSTNIFLIEANKTPDNKTTICFAESQTAGKGRLGRQWISPFGCNIYLSFLWNFKCGADRLSGLSIAVGMVVIATLKAYGILDAIKLKWPNDILWQGKKLGGILVELTNQGQNSSSAVIGVGLNVDMPEQLGQDISQPWCDITQIIQKTPQRNKLAGLLLDKLLDAMRLYQLSGFAPFQSKWKDLDAFYGQEISITTFQEKTFGIDRGVDAKGGLLLEDASGKLNVVTVGEVSW